MLLLIQRYIKKSVRIKVPNSVNASKRKQINHYNKPRRVLMTNSTVCLSKWKPVVEPQRAKPKTCRQAPTHWLSFTKRPSLRPEEAVIESEAVKVTSDDGPQWEPKLSHTWIFLPRKGTKEVCAIMLYSDENIQRITIKMITLIKYIKALSLMLMLISYKKKKHPLCIKLCTFFFSFLFTGQYLRQMFPANETGYAFGYKRNKFHKRCLGYFPASHVQVV